MENANAESLGGFKFRRDLYEEVHAVILEHPEWTNKQISEETGAGPKQVSNYKTNHKKTLTEEFAKRGIKWPPEAEAAAETPKESEAVQEPAQPAEDADVTSIAILKRKYEAKLNELDSMAQQLKTANEEADILQGKLDDAAKHIEDLEAEINMQSEMLYKRDEQIHDYESIKHDYEGIRAGQEARISELQETMLKEREDFKDKEDQLRRDYAAKVTDNAGQVQALKDERDLLEEEKAELELKVNKLKDAVMFFVMKELEGKEVC